MWNGDEKKKKEYEKHRSGSNTRSSGEERKVCTQNRSNVDLRSDKLFLFCFWRLRK